MKLRIFSVLLAFAMSTAVLASCVSGKPSLSDQTASDGSGSSISSSESGSEPVSSATSAEDSDSASKLTAEAGDYPSAFMVEKENNFDYQPGLECSAFSSAYVLRHYGEEAEGLQLFENFPSKLADGAGVFPDGIVTLFESKGYQAEFVTNGTIENLKSELAKGAPVIVFIHVEEPYESPHNTHYIPVVGYDEEYLYFAESLSQYANCKDEEGLPYNRKTAIEKFKKLWANIDDYYDYPYFKITPSAQGE